METILENEVYPERHFYLYSKNHYIKSDNIISDLKVILSYYTGISYEELSDYDVVRKVMDISYTSSNEFHNVNKLFMTYGDYKYFGITLEEQEKYNRLLYNKIIFDCINRILVLTKVDEIPFELGNISVNIQNEIFKRSNIT